MRQRLVAIRHTGKLLAEGRPEKPAADAAQPKQGRGRPRKAKLPRWQTHQLAARPFVFTHIYEPDWTSHLTPAEVARQLREYASKQDPLAVELANWCCAIADAAESGNAVQAAHCGLIALKELGALVAQHVAPLAQVGREKLDADKRKGHRGKPE